MANLTRDPFHAVKSNYIQNMSNLTITVDGLEIDSNHCLNVYQDAFQKRPYVEMFLIENGKIAETVVDGKTTYVTYKLEGDIEISGRPAHCGCWRGRQTKHWWRRLKV